MRLRYSSVLTFCVLGTLSLRSYGAPDVIMYGTAGANPKYDLSKPGIVTLDYTAGTVLAMHDAPSADVGNGWSGASFRQSTGELYISDAPGPPDPNTPTPMHIFVVDPDTGAVNRTLSYQPSFNSGADGLAFIGDRFYQAFTYNPTILDTDPDTGGLGNFEIIGLIGTGHGLATVGETFYISYTDSSNHNAIAAFSQSDGANYGQLLYSYPTPDNLLVNALAGDGGSLYAAAENGRIYRLNPATGAILGSRDFGSLVLDGLAVRTAPLPEPSLAMGLGASLAAMGLRRRRKGPRRCPGNDSAASRLTRAPIERCFVCASLPHSRRRF